jgi:hypothetical protein
MTNKPPPKAVDFTFSEEPEVQKPESFDSCLTTDLDTGEDNPNFVYDDDDDEYDDDNIGIQIEEKEEIDDVDIFDNQDDNLPEINIITKLPPKKIKPTTAPIKLTKTGKIRKPMTDEHKEILRKGREKAQETRRNNKIMRDKNKITAREQAKADKAFAEEEAELTKKVRVKRVQKMKAEVDDDVVPEVIQQHQQRSGLSKKELEEIQLDAIMKYDALRKTRKAEKRKEQMIQAEKDKLRQAVLRAQPTQYQYRDGSNRFDNCY